MYTVPTNSKVTIGYVYPSWYLTAISVEDAAQKGVMQLQRLKGVKYVYVVVDGKDRDKFIASDVNLLTQTYAALVSKLKTMLDVNVTLLLQHQGNQVTAEDLLTYVEGAEEDYYVFKEQLQGIGYSHQVCVWNRSEGYFSLTAVDVETKLKGKRYLSGST